MEAVFSILGKRYEDALKIAEVILREHTAPRVPEAEVPSWTQPALSTGLERKVPLVEMVSGSELRWKHLSHYWAI